MLKYVINYVMENAPEEMNFFNSFVDKGLIDRLTNVATSEFARITYTDAIEILKKHNDKFEFKVSWGIDLTDRARALSDRESIQTPSICNRLSERYQSILHETEPDGKTVAAVDCLVPGIGEIIGGSQREDDYEKLATRIGRTRNEDRRLRILHGP